MTGFIQTDTVTVRRPVTEWPLDELAVGTPPDEAAPVVASGVVAAFAERRHAVRDIDSGAVITDRWHRVLLDDDDGDLNVRAGDVLQPSGAGSGGPRPYRVTHVYTDHDHHGLAVVRVDARQVG